MEDESPKQQSSQVPGSLTDPVQENCFLQDRENPHVYTFLPYIKIKSQAARCANSNFKKFHNEMFEKCILFNYRRFNLVIWIKNASFYNKTEIQAMNCHLML